MREIIIGENEYGQRLDRFLLKYLNNSTRANVYKLLRKKIIKVNGKREKENYFLKLGDRVQIFLSDETLDKLRKEEKIVMDSKVNLDIVYEDDEILVVNKPKGLLTHPDKKEYKKTLSTRVQAYLKHLSTRTFNPASINRLDQNTSGLVIFCKTYEALKKYNEMMRNREIKKYYLCIVHGIVKKEGEIKGHIVKNTKTNVVQIFDKNNKNGQFIYTKYKPIRYLNNNYTLLEVEILTGKTHQIRASLSKINHPIIGDTKYGGKKIDNITTQVLHAYKLIIGDKVIVKKSKLINELIDKLS
ncbi:RluA family pseudouridine synthase [Caminicella sporogenes]|uniref:RluA family pseudouridine synthase n=1 Tax=Caminicella sporogenes TaxID=166485 RepID=UPI00254069BF|nr:RluA family pseudouridine synthase [Caminicella sporogenes]WIF94988.1 RluA family pseudouridine synthase [Caminicella sporogenes]